MIKRLCHRPFFTGLLAALAEGLIGFHLGYILGSKPELPPSAPVGIQVIINCPLAP